MIAKSNFKNKKQMKPSFLTSSIQKFYPATAGKIIEIIESNVLLEKLATKVYNSAEFAVQKYADIAERIKIIVRMLQSWNNKEYTDIPYTTIFLSTAILLYFVSPIDLFPDFIPIIGGLDDMILLGFLLETIDKEIEKFIAWESKYSK